VRESSATQSCWVVPLWGGRRLRLEMNLRSSNYLTAFLPIWCASDQMIGNAWVFRSHQPHFVKKKSVGRWCTRKKKLGAYRLGRLPSFSFPLRRWVPNPLHAWNTSTMLVHHFCNVLWFCLANGAHAWFAWRDVPFILHTSRALSSLRYSLKLSILLYRLLNFVFLLLESQGMYESA